MRRTRCRRGGGWINDAPIPEPASAPGPFNSGCPVERRARSAILSAQDGDPSISMGADILLRPGEVAKAYLDLL